MELQYDLDQFRRGSERLARRYDEVLTELAKQEDQLAYLDRCRKREDKDLADTSRALASLEPADIFEHFQPEVLVWAASNAVFARDTRRLLKGLEDLLGMDCDIFERARLWEWQENNNAFGSNVLNQYVVLEAFQSEPYDEIELGDYLMKHARDGVTISESRAADYGLQPLRIQRDDIDILSTRGREENWGRFDYDKLFGMYLDTPSGFALTYKGKPQAIVAVTADGPDGVAIHQLQGFKGEYESSDYTAEPRRVSARGLAVLDWRALMVDLTADITHRLGKSQLIIKGASNNYWIKPRRPGTEPHLSLDQAVAAYDKPAQRLGFKQREDRDWVRSLAA